MKALVHRIKEKNTKEEMIDWLIDSEKASLNLKNRSVKL